MNNVESINEVKTIDFRAAQTGEIQLNDEIRGVCIINLRGQIIKVNQLMKEIFEYSENELMGMYIWELAKHKFQIRIAERIFLNNNNNGLPCIEANCLTKNKKNKRCDLNIQYCCNDELIVCEITDKSKCKPKELNYYLVRAI